MTFNPLTESTDFRLKLYPKDVHRVRAFYEKVLQYPIIDEWDNGENDRGVMFDTGTATLELISPKPVYVPIRGTNLALEVRDVMATWEYLKDKAEVEFEPRHNAWGDTSFRILDPEGFQLTFFTKD